MNKEGPWEIVLYCTLGLFRPIYSYFADFTCKTCDQIIKYNALLQIKPWNSINNSLNWVNIDAPGLINH